ncbi:hypothetical protein FIV42_07055 [Persicimonas caeni]|uniref:YokE-like PH domain-containing protein n=1 Tax=Persicimonas caeni TaxID=2292766 RepID=A0A4Y6PR57_PERCE|nr:hypothetical protein [Persicimonas caeni]QDG50497.1 hypothetical protein FIV42_07055 [Persicimonas caeni]
MGTFDIIMIGVTIAFFALIPLVLRWSHRKRDGAAAEVRELLGEDNILLCDTSALFDGVASEGMLQTRGNGCLALTKAGLLFVWWHSREKIQIPVSHLRGVERVPSRRNGVTGRELIRIHTRDGAGADDTVSFYVEKVAAWVAVIERLIHAEDATTRGLEADEEREALPQEAPAEDGVLW